MSNQREMTEQESFWSGQFGDEYIDRNDDARLVAANTAMFAEILRHTRDVRSVLEFGANIGNNLRALQSLLPQATLTAIEINAKACERLAGVAYEVLNMSFLDFSPEQTWDFVLIKGVLIHTNPEKLPDVYERLHKATGRYLCVCEYYNPMPVEVTYRGQTGQLFKRDFAGEILDMFPDLRLLGYGFCYRRDPTFLFGDVTWFLMTRH